MSYDERSWVYVEGKRTEYHEGIIAFIDGKAVNWMGFSAPSDSDIATAVRQRQYTNVSVKAELYVSEKYPQFSEKQIKIVKAVGDGFRIYSQDYMNGVAFGLTQSLDYDQSTAIMAAAKDYRKFILEHSKAPPK